MDGDGGVPTTEVNSERRVSLLMAHSSGSGLRHGRGLACGRGRGRGFTSSSLSSSLASYRVSTAQSLRYDDGNIEKKGSDSDGRDGDDAGDDDDDRDATKAMFPGQQPRYDAQRSVARSMAALNHHARPVVCGGRIRGGWGWQGRDANPAADPTSAGDAPETR